MAGAGAGVGVAASYAYFSMHFFALFRAERALLLSGFAGLAAGAGFAGLAGGAGFWPYGAAGATLVLFGASTGFGHGLLSASILASSALI